MSDAIYRHPKTGRFIGYGEIMQAWMPEIVGQWGEIADAMAALQSVCTNRAALRLELAAEALRRGDDSGWQVKQYEKCLAMRRILREAEAQLRQVRNA